MGKLLDFETRAAVIREARQKPEPTFMMIAAAENVRIAENARRLGEAMDRLADIPSDSEG